jgi:hypothetical protein
VAPAEPRGELPLGGPRRSPPKRGLQPRGGPPAGGAAINERYLDKNYGATLIVWDRLFGTYAEEPEPPVYGITNPLGSFDPM